MKSTRIILPSSQQTIMAALTRRRGSVCFSLLRVVPKIQPQHQPQPQQHRLCSSVFFGSDRSSVSSSNASTISSLSPCLHRWNISNHDTMRFFSNLGKKKALLDNDYRYPPLQDNNNNDNDDDQHQQSLLLEDDYEDLIHVARQRKLYIAVHTGTKAGIVTGLLVMGGVIVAGPVGAVVGGTLGTGWALRASRRGGVSVAQVLRETPLQERPEVCRQVVQALRSEFSDGFSSHPEVKLMLSQKKGRMGTTMSVVKYCLEKRMMDDTKLQKLDGILKEHAAKKIK